MAEELARRSPNLNKGSHPYDLPDEKAVTEQLGETGAQGAIDKRPSEDEADYESTYPKTRTSVVGNRVVGRGGGVGIHDLAEEQSGNTDPEWLVLGPDTDKPPKKKSDKNNWTRRIELNKLGFDSEIYDKFADLSRIWTDKKTEITYKVGERPELDQIIFKNSALKWRGEKQKNETTLTPDELHFALDKFGIDLNTHRPVSSEDKKFFEDLKHLRLGAGILNSETVNVEFSKAIREKQGQESTYFNLSLNPKMLEKYTTAEEKGQVEFFLGQLKHTDIGWFGFDVDKNGEIISVTSVTKKGERMKIPAHLFRKVFENVLPYKKGFDFVIPGIKRASILPGMNPEEVKEVMSKVKIDGKALPDDTIYFMG